MMMKVRIVVSILWSILILLLSICLYYYQYIIIADLDLISYGLAKSSLAVSPPQFPVNSSDRIATIRDVTKYSTIYGVQPLSLLFNPSLMRINFVDVSIPVDGGDTSISLRIYNHQPEGTKKPVLIFFHGGGFILFSANEFHILALTMARETDFIVVNVDYRLAPENIFPAAVNDAYTSLEWVIANIQEYGGDSQKIILAGESAGGNLAAAVTSQHLLQKVETICEMQVRLHDEDQMLCGKLHNQIERQERWHEIIGVWLIYPVLDATTASPEAQQYAYVNGMLTIDEMEWMRKLYQGSNDFNPTIRYNYRYAPLYTPNLIISVYPPTLFMLAEQDILTHESFLFIEKLRHYLRSVHSIVFTSTVHAFLSAHPFLGPQAISYAATYMQQQFQV